MSEDEPLGIVEDADTGDRFLVYQTAKGPRLDIRFSGDSLWMSQQQIAQLFGKDISSVSRHIANVIADGELESESNLQKVQIANSDKPVALYSLDMVISVGYRVSSTQATVFRRWATAALVQYARKGFVVDSVRLKQPNASDRIAELREIIRDIRSDESNLYAELRQICSLCQDYDGKTESATTLKSLNRAVLRDGGSVQRASADQHALGEYEKYSARKKEERRAEADAAIAALVAEGRELPKGKNRS
jgi:hypothetical protein